MSRLLPFAASLPCPGLKRVLTLAILTFAASIHLLPAQTSASAPVPATIQSAPATLPADPSPAPPASYSIAAPAFSGTGLQPVAGAFGQPPAQPPVPPGGANSNPPQWSRSMLDPFQPGPGFGNFSGSAGGLGFNGAASATGFGAGRQSPGGFNRYSAASMDGRPGNLAPLFPIGSSTRDLASGANGPFAAAPLTLPSLNQLMRGSLSLPLHSPSSAFRPSYQDRFGPGGDIGDLGRASASTMFTTSNLGNGMFLSAGTTNGSRSMAGAPAASLGNNASGGQKHSGPSVAIKLSF